jgi:hypothetical protein
VPVTVSTPARNVSLTTLAQLKAELGLTTVENDALLTDTIRRSSAAIEAYCHRTFAREAVSETLPAFGGPYLMLDRYPVATVSSVTYDDAVWTDYSLYDKGCGTLYRQDGWTWSAQVFPGLSGGGRFADWGSPIPGSEEPLVTVEYTAGYLLPGDNLLKRLTLSASAVDNSFNDSADGFPTMLKAGDVIEAFDFQNAANNGRHLVTGTPTASKIVVTSTLVNESAGGVKPVSIRVQTLPDDVEKACLQSTKVYFLGRQTDPGVVEKQVGPMRVRYSESDNVTLLSLPSEVVGLLAPYVRRA